MTAKLPRGIRNNNPGNLNFVGQAGAVLETDVPVADRRFAKFPTMDKGILALINQLRLYFERGTNTVQSIISKWAPPTENNTQAYIVYVARHMDVLPNTVLTPTAPILALLADAIIHLENGQQPVSGNQLLSLALAGTRGQTDRVQAHGDGNIA